MHDVTVSELCRELKALNERRGSAYYIKLHGDGSCSARNWAGSWESPAGCTPHELLDWLRKQNTPTPPTPAEDVEALRKLFDGDGSNTFCDRKETADACERLARLREAVK